MVESKECRAKFDKVTAGLENQGYMDWKKWVLKQVEGYSDDKLQNLIKRTEIKLKIEEENRELTTLDMMKACLSVITIMLTTLATITVAMVNTITSIYNSYIDKADINEYAKIIENMSEKMFGQLLAVCVFFAMVYIIFYAIEKVFDSKMLLKKAKMKVYYRELLEILKEKLEGKQAKVFE